MKNEITRSKKYIRIDTEYDFICLEYDYRLQFVDIPKPLAGDASDEQLFKEARAFLDNRRRMA